MCSCVFNVGSCVAICLTFRLFFNFRPLATWLLMKNRVERHQQSWYLINFLTTFWHFNCLDVNTHFFFLQWNNEFYSYGHSFSYSEIRNFTAITKWLFVFFYSKVLKTVSKRPCFYCEIQNFENYTQTAVPSLTTKYETFENVPE